MATVAQARRTRRSWLSRIDQRHVIVYGTALVLAVTVVVPLAVMVIISLRPTEAIPPITGTDFTLDNYRTTFADPVTYRLLWNTALYALGSMAVGLVLGVLMSWFVGRTNLPFRNGVYPMALASFAMPGVVTAFGWIVLGRPRTGILNTIIRGMTGSDANTGPLNVFTLEGMILVTGVALAGSMFIFLAPYFQRMDPALEEAATTSGAGRLGTLRHVSIPLLFPGILTVAVYYVVIMVQIFEFPLAIGVTAGVPVLSVRVFLLTQPEFGLINYGLAATFAMIAMFIGLVLLGVYLWVTRQAERYQVITGKGYRPNRMDLGFWKWAAGCGAFGVIGLKVIITKRPRNVGGVLGFFNPLGHGG
ncbi:MAG: ABC transporter permease subunit, partial [Chloroflexota bacterium]|nr:ABC transporter permease subunit [Chloroflexota bacterium]